MSEAVTHAEHHTSTGVDNRMLMMWIFLASECLFFGSLISTYLIYQGESLVGPLPGELLNIPIFGWYLKKIGSISVNRNKISKDYLGLIDKIKNAVDSSNRPIIIFPQATRVLPKEKIPFKKGVGRVYNELGIKCQPVAINSGNVWPKNGFMKKNKDITISILKPIEPGMKPDDFTDSIERNIYSELDLIG